MRKDFAGVLNGWYTSFRCESWSKSKLGEVNTLPVIDLLGQRNTYIVASYLAHPRRVLPGGGLDLTDLVVAADVVPAGTLFNQKEPLIVGYYWENNDRLVLWEGNFRAALFFRVADADAEILVWGQHEENWPKFPA